jgi:hypothetical protein
MVGSFLSEVMILGSLRNEACWNFCGFVVDFRGGEAAKHYGVFSRRYGCDGHLGGFFDGQ